MYMKNKNVYDIKFIFRVNSHVAAIATVIMRFTFFVLGPQLEMVRNHGSWCSVNI